MDVSKRFFDGERKLFNGIKVSGVLGKNIFSAYLLESWHLCEILKTSPTVKSRKNVVKSRCFEKRLGWRAPFFFRSKGSI